MTRARAIVTIFLLTALGGASASAGAFLKIDGALPDGGDCALFGSWNSATSTCRIDSAVLPLGDRLDISQSTVVVEGTLVNEGLLVNDGLMLVTGFFDSTNDFVNNWTATMVVRGQFFSHFMYNFGQLTVEPEGLVEFDFFLENNGPLLNRGTVSIGGTVFTIPGRLIENLGTTQITASGSFSNEGRLVNAGSLDNQGTLQNNADFIHHCDAALTGIPPTGETPTGGLSLRLGPGALTWCEVPNAPTYDVVRGDLGLLHAGGGDFTVATLECLADSIPDLSLEHSTSPGPGEGWWFLVRGDGVESAGFDSVFASQIAGRAGEIAASAARCH